MRSPPSPWPGKSFRRSKEATAAGVGQTSAKYLPGTRLVRAFRAVDASAASASAGRQSEKLGVPVAGDDVEAVQVAAQLVRDAGCEPVVVGNLAAARSFQRGGAGLPGEHDGTGAAAPARPARREVTPDGSYSARHVTGRPRSKAYTRIRGLLWPNWRSGRAIT